ncbi:MULTISPECIES: hypothetical protein [Sediminibacillus]|uniref:hypothetical protein n=1 Tax=Sediminibacillus TaxID=482460 RepID=UPI001294D429|nr:hypothetical protein [Sediminibacillus terrae]
MNKMKFSLGIMMAVLLLISLGACSKANDETSSTPDTSTKEESVDSSNSPDEDSNEQDSKKQEEEDEPDSEVEKNQNTSEADHESDTETPDEQTEANMDESDSNREDIENYLNEKYAIENTHYTTETWQNEDTGKTEYMVKILPDTKESDEEITGALKNGETDERIDRMMDLAEKIMDDLTEKNNNIHVDSVNYVSYDGEYSLTLIQDYK